MFLDDSWLADNISGVVGCECTIAVPVAGSSRFGEGVETAEEVIRDAEDLLPPAVLLLVAMDPYDFPEDDDNPMGVMGGTVTAVIIVAGVTSLSSR
jgi:hypothetical protein